MTHRFNLSAHAMSQFLALPPQLRKDAALAILLLGHDPVPRKARPYAGIPDAYRLDEGNVTILYRVPGGEIDIEVIRPNS